MVRTPGIDDNVYFPVLIRSVQVSVQEYLQAVSTNLAEGHAGVDVPDFRSLVTDLRRGTFHLSSNWVPLPESYMEVRSGSGGGGSRAPSAVPTIASTVVPHSPRIQRERHQGFASLTPH